MLHAHTINNIKRANGLVGDGVKVEKSTRTIRHYEWNAVVR
jgi:hypothetical protein